jgi:hypothetical protein
MRVIILFISILPFINTSLAQNLSYKKSTEGVEISENNKPVLFFQTKPKSVEGKYERSGYVHPLYGLDGNVVTEDMPEDHPYHRGIFWAWHQVIVNGKNVADGWMSDKITFEPGKIQVKKSDKNIILNSQLVWKITDSGKAPVNIINEISRINILKAEEHFRIIDFSILLKPLVKNISLGGSDDIKGYGGFCLRLKLPENIQFISGDEIVEPKETAVMAGPWMDFKMNGPGVVVLGYKNEKDEKHPWILRKAKSMQNVPYPGRTPVAIPAEGLKLDYRVILHDETLTKDEIEKLYRDYIDKL